MMYILEISCVLREKNHLFSGKGGVLTRNSGHTR